MGIETSCDETGLALVDDGGQILAEQLASSLPSHQRFGGIVPEIASRAHVECLLIELENLLERAGVTPRAVERIAVTAGPGLPGALLVGIAAAKALAMAWRIPLVGVNHLQAHLYVALMKGRTDFLEAPTVGLVVSGGHTALLRLQGFDRMEVLGQTRDDAVGEAFDKVAKLLGLGFPGGPVIERTAREGNPKAFRFPTPRLKAGSPHDFSLSGLKTAALLRVQKEQASGGALSCAFVADLAASFQRCIVEEVTAKTLAACEAAGARRLVLGGGVVANRDLRQRLVEAAAERGVETALPERALCTDNGVMVAALGRHLLALPPGRLNAVPDLGVASLS